MTELWVCVKNYLVEIDIFAIRNTRLKIITNSAEYQCLNYDHNEIQGLFTADFLFIKSYQKDVLTTNHFVSFSALTDDVFSLKSDLENQTYLESITDFEIKHIASSTNNYELVYNLDKTEKDLKTLKNFFLGPRAGINKKLIANLKTPHENDSHLADRLETKILKAVRGKLDKKSFFYDFSTFIDETYIKVEKSLSNTFNTNLSDTPDLIHAFYDDISQSCNYDELSGRDAVTTEQLGTFSTSNIVTTTGIDDLAKHSKSYAQIKQELLELNLTDMLLDEMGDESEALVYPVKPAEEEIEDLEEDGESDTDDEYIEFNLMDDCATSHNPFTVNLFTERADKDVEKTNLNIIEFHGFSLTINESYLKYLENDEKLRDFPPDKLPFEDDTFKFENGLILNVTTFDNSMDDWIQRLSVENLDYTERVDIDIWGKSQVTEINLFTHHTKLDELTFDSPKFLDEEDDEYDSLCDDTGSRTVNEILFDEITDSHLFLERIYVDCVHVPFNKKIDNLNIKIKIVKDLIIAIAVFLFIIFLTML